MARNNKPKIPAWKRNPAYRDPTDFSWKRPAANVAAPPIVDPWNNDAAYQGEMTSAGLRRDQAKLRLAGRQSEAEQGYGYRVGEDGELDESSFASNPYTRAAMMKANYDRQVRGTTNSSAARGQLYSGAVDRARLSDAAAYTGQRSEAINDFTRLMAEIEQGRTDADTSYAETDRVAKQAALDRALADLDASQFPEDTQSKSPRVYQQEINRLLRSAKRTPWRRRRIQELTKLRNNAQGQVNG